MENLFLSISNVAIVPTVVVCYKRGYNVEGTAFLMAGLASTVYHLFEKHGHQDEEGMHTITMPGIGLLTSHQSQYYLLKGDRIFAFIAAILMLLRQHKLMLKEPMVFFQCLLSLVILIFSKLVIDLRLNRWYYISLHTLWHWSVYASTYMVMKLR